LEGTKIIVLWEQEPSLFIGWRGRGSYVIFKWVQQTEFGYVWQCGSGCFSNNFSCRNACQWCFFIF
jgi:hypothetical protein